MRLERGRHDRKEVEQMSQKEAILLPFILTLSTSILHYQSVFLMGIITIASS